MSIAEVTYTGTMRSMFARGYKFRNPSGGSPMPTSVNSVEDAEWFEDNDTYVVEWSAQGRLARHLGGPVEDMKAALSDLSYRQKQKLVKAYEINIKGNAAEDDLDEALKPVAEELAQQMEVR